jgi:hypothetical protein
MASSGSARLAADCDDCDEVDKVFAYIMKGLSEAILSYDNCGFVIVCGGPLPDGCIKDDIIGAISQMNHRQRTKVGLPTQRGLRLHDCKHRTIAEEDLPGECSGEQYATSVYYNAGWVLLQYQAKLQDIIKGLGITVILHVDPVFLPKYRKLEGVRAFVYSTGTFSGYGFVRDHGHLYPVHMHAEIPWATIPESEHSSLRGSESVDGNQWVGVRHLSEPGSPDNRPTRDCHHRRAMCLLCPEECGCSNTVRRSYPSLAIVRSKMFQRDVGFDTGNDHAKNVLGVITTEFIQEGAFICEFVGIISNDSDAYSMSVGNNRILQIRGIAALVNHQCINVSCRCEKWVDGENKTDRYFLVATRDIPAGSELTWNYGSNRRIDRCVCTDCLIKLPPPVTEGNAMQIII